ncbi:hypothetical protein Glove_320g123 [Diversispora epigaea]|uniref:Uncharacterized protein n=1 Tax=Diversispora epigaea TaxID=1348612 RepID=A0A397HU18_9GLOM|nr:hypothetical protein Glove_320g123 [Diversispora epigaea]
MFIKERHNFGLDVNSLEYITAIKKTVKNIEKAEIIWKNDYQRPILEFHANMASYKFMRVDCLILVGNKSQESKFETILKAVKLFSHSADSRLRRINFSGNILDNSLEQVYEFALNHNSTSQDLWDSYISWILDKWEISKFKNKNNAVPEVTSMRLNEETSNIKDLIMVQYINRIGLGKNSSSLQRGLQNIFKYIFCLDKHGSNLMFHDDVKEHSFIISFILSLYDKASVKNDSLPSLLPSLHHDRKTRCKDTKFKESVKVFKRHLFVWFKFQFR